MIPYGHQNIDQTDIKEVIKVLRSDWLTQGPKVFEFEKALAEYCGVKYAVAVNNGTAALHLAYLAAGLKAGDEVITAPNTFAATSNMLLTAGAKPVFCDIRLDTYNIDEAKIEKLISGKTRVIAPVDFSGQPCALDQIKKIAKKYKLTVVEDACHALGAKYKNKKIGSLSDMTVFSFHPVKSITTGEGGAVLTNSKKYCEKLKLLRNHGMYKDKYNKNVMIALGHNYRLADIQAALGVSQLKRLDSFIKKRRQVVEWYKRELRDVKEIILPEEIKDNYSAWHIYVIRTVNLKERDRLAEYLKNKGVAVNFHYPAVYAQPYYRKNGYKAVKLENEEIYQASCLTLPCYAGLTEKQVKFISGLIKKYFKIYKNKLFENKESRGLIMGERVYLRKLTPADASNDYCAWLNDKEVNKYLETRKCTLAELKKYLKEKSSKIDCLLVGIFDKKNDSHIGNIKLEPIDRREKKAVYGILIGDKNYWGKGIGEEATKLIIAHAFKKLGLTSLELGVISQNKKAVKLYKKLKFKIKKIEKRAINHNGVFYDKIIMSIKK
ncbi:UDP-4-amino-4,6-dideoxy-N-acetyl-beta-L-altrosamine transaminase [Candidatus Falkowbacteria bacterium]|nr:UDP-4-amino-4,6-dideoxy-N-acetyl-beta-L-altrosamine transaminase [Candidatus Falkowbacteria bacterium]